MTITIYNIYIFDRMGTLLYHANWNRLKQSGMSSEEVTFLDHSTLLVYYNCIMHNFTGS